MTDYDNRDIEDFTLRLGVAIYDLNKKHNNILHRTNLGNVLTPFFRFNNYIIRSRKDEEEENSNDRKKF